MRHPQTKGPFTSKQLGITYPYIDKIYYGFCGNGTEEKHGYDYDEWRSYRMGAAHTHVCSDDKIRGAVCFQYREDIFNYEGMPSDIYWHEYGHILTMDLFGKECVGSYSGSEGEDEIHAKVQAIGHNPEWIRIMEIMQKKVHRQYYIKAGLPLPPLQNILDIIKSLPRVSNARIVG